MTGRNVMIDRPLEELLRGFVDEAWYLARYPDVASSNMQPLEHFIRFGAAERRDPNRFFDSAWYLESNPDVAASGQHPLLHYLEAGARELRRPHPRFDAAWYAAQHPEAADNPLLHHMRFGLRLGYLTEKALELIDYLPSVMTPPVLPSGVFADIVMVIDKGQRDAKACLKSVMANRGPALARIIVVQDGPVDADLGTWLRELAMDGLIHLIGNRRTAGFAAAVNRGIRDAENHDIVLLYRCSALHGDWLTRLASHAYKDRDIGIVAPLTRRLGPVWSKTARSIDGCDTLAADTLDQLCANANAGRTSDVAALGAACLYIKAATVAALGGMDEVAGLSPPQTVIDFCLRAADRGARCQVAWDCFTDAAIEEADHSAPRALLKRHPNCVKRIDAALKAAEPFHFVHNAALIRFTERPTILMVSHTYGGGVRRHIHSLAAHYAGQAWCLSLEGNEQSVTLSVLGLCGSASMTLAAGRLDDMVTVLRSMNVSRLHIHHLLKVEMDIQRLIQRLGVPFDVTIHDYFTICPQINMLKSPESLFCEGPPPGVCNACLADNNPQGARDIFHWRGSAAWLFTEADRVICPSEDVKIRLQRYGLAANAIVVPHQAQPDPWWHTQLPPLSGVVLRVAVLGVLANHKGARTVASVATAPGCNLAIHLIGSVENTFPEPARRLIQQTGHYQEADLPRLLKEARPHVIWMPNAWPETFSYTLTSAIETGLPIIATNLGALPERLAGRPHTWLVDHRATTTEWLATFAEVRALLHDRTPAPAKPRAVVTTAFYDTSYLSPPRPKKRAHRPKIVILPEYETPDRLTTRAYQRLLLPLDHAVGHDHDIVLADPATVLAMECDFVITHRRAIGSPQTCARLLEHIEATGAALIYDLDDDLTRERDTGGPQVEAARAVRTLVRSATSVWLSTDRLAQRLSKLRPDAAVLETRLDERIWDLTPPPAPFWPDPVRILCMGNITHDQDYALIESVLMQLHAEYGDRIVIDIIGMTDRFELGGGIRRPAMTPHAGRSHPAFVQWLTSVRPGWDIGLAPIADTTANRYRSDFKALDYAALGLYILASEVPQYRGSVADGPAGQLVPNNPESWYAAISWAIRDQTLRQTGYQRSRAAFAKSGTLASQSEQRRAALAEARKRVRARTRKE